MPEILASDLKDQSVYESTPISFEVIAQGIPKPEAEWLLNGKRLTADEHYNIIQDDLRYKLVIADVKLSDQGQFQAIIKNQLSELTKQCKLDVMRKLLLLSRINCSGYQANRRINKKRISFICISK